MYHKREPDTLGLAREAVRAGIIKQDVLNHLTSLDPRVPGSVKYRYLLMHVQKASLKFRSMEFCTPRLIERFLYFPEADDATNTSATNMAYVFVSEDIPVLVEFLSGHAHIWWLLGTALDFKSSEIRYIKANNSSEDEPLKCALINLISDWVEKAEHATVSNLKRALSSQLVNLGALANQLEETVFKKTLLKPDYALPYTESSSVLLEAQVTPNDKLTTPTTRSYKWLRDKHALKEGPMFSGTTGPILRIASDIDVDSCEFSCQIEVGTSPRRETTPVTLRVSCPLDKFRESLASIYLAQPEVPEDTWPPVSSNRFINLVLIKQQTINYRTKYAHLTIRGDPDDILQHKEDIEYTEVWNSLKSGQTLFIEGRPGSGKTTFVHKISRDWAASSNGAIRLLLLVSLRVLNNLSKNTLDLSDILNLFQDLKVKGELIEERCGKGVCFIFDGLDEYSPRDKKTSIVYKIINRTYLAKSTVIVASRPAATASLRSRANKAVEVLGFKNEQIYEYFDCYPFSDTSKPDKLKRYLSSHPNILHMCYLPIHAAMVAFIFERTGEVPQTETNIYELFTQFTVRRSLTKNEEVEIAGVITGEKENLLNQISKLALEKTMQNKQVLHQHEVDLYFQTNKDEDISLGLITVDRIAGLYHYIENIYTFLHLTFQEYLAAHHISTLSDKAQHQFLQDHGHKIHMLVVWKFYCGLAKELKFKSIFDKTRGRSLFHIHCAYESQKQVVCTQFLEYTGYHIQFLDEHLTASDFTAIGYVLKESQIPIELSIVGCTLGLEARIVLDNVTRLNVTNTCLSEETLTDILHCKGLVKLGLVNSIGGRLIEVLAEGLKHCGDLEELDLTNNGLDDHSIAELAGGLEFCGALLKLKIMHKNQVTLTELQRLFYSSSIREFC